MTTRSSFLALAFACGRIAAAAEDPVPAATPASTPEPRPGPEVVAIQDNSFLIEEAYNQEPGVVQHIFGWSRDHESGDWSLGLTQEWPLFDQHHQVSFSLPVERMAAGTRIGDLALNYRYQAVGVDGGPVAFAPRVSFVAPTGSDVVGGQSALQLNLPLSLDTGRNLVLHTNAGVSRAFAAGGRPAVTRWNLGQSLIWLAHPRVNLMLEAVAVHARDAGGDGEWEPLVGPGVRVAIDWGGLQVVPGLALQFGLGPASEERRVFLYLSLEHPFR